MPNVLAVISVGSDARDPAINSVTNRIYVANASSDTVSVIDGATDTLVATIPVGNAPSSAAVNALTNRIYVPNSADHTVSVIDGATNMEVDTDGNAGNGLTRIPIVGSTNTQQAAVDATTNRVFIANEFSKSISVVDGATNTQIDTDGNAGNGITNIATSSNLLGVSVNPSTNRLYAAGWSTALVSVFNATTYAPITTIAMPVRAVDVAINTSTNTLYATDESAGVVVVIDGSSNAVNASVSVGGGPGRSVVDSTTNHVFVATQSANVLKFLDATTNTVTGGISMTYPHSAALNSATGKLYVAQPTIGKVTVLSFPPHPSAPTSVTPNLLNFQGRLTAASGSPLADGNYSIGFRLFDSLTGGSMIWSESQTVAVSGSVFSVLLGTNTPLAAGAFASEPRYLEVQVGADPPLSPRQRFTSVPYAFNAQSLDGVGAGELMARDGIVLHVGTAQSCPSGFTLLMDVNAGVNGTDASRACSSAMYTQVFYIGSAQTCPAGWTQVDINAAVVGTAAADACYR